MKAQLAAYEKQAESGQGSTDANGRKTYANVANRNRAIQQLQSQIANTC
jgi:VCBS repeat-containing protein